MKKIIGYGKGDDFDKWIKEFYHLAPDAKLIEMNIDPENNEVSLLVEDNEGKRGLLIGRMPKGYDLSEKWCEILND